MAQCNIYVAMHNILAYIPFMDWRTIMPPRGETPMSTKKAKPEMHSEAQAQVANFAQKTVDQAQAAFEKVSEVAHSNVQIMDEAANAYKNRVTDIQLKTMEFAQLNLNAGFAFARKFVAVRDPAEAMNLQQAFFKEQAETLQRQAAELSELSVALAKESMKPVQETMTKSFTGFSKAVAA
jgi:phasin